VMDAVDAIEKIRVGVSSCLLGQEVRFDSGHKHDRYVTDVLGQHFDFVSVCPEVEVGMGIPRESVRLVRETGSDGPIRMLGVKSGTDHTEAMRRYARRRVAAVAALGIRGYILKKGSPSCGMERVRTYTAAGMPATSDRGLFAAALVEAMPSLPLEEEGRLGDAMLRENFIERVFAWSRVSRMFSGRWSVGGLVAFHSREKMLVSAHRPESEKVLGRIVAAAKKTPRAEVAEEYRRVFLEALSKPSPRRRHVNVLQHMLGHFRERLEAAPRHALAAVIEDYRRGLVPLVVPITLMRHYVDLLGIEYLARQTYLEPHPRELLLRNHV
ncbi:MAG: YbgA family protein, partial [Candidatus Binatia bacterium]